MENHNSKRVENILDLFLTELSKQKQTENKLAELINYDVETAKIFVKQLLEAGYIKTDGSEALRLQPKYSLTEIGKQFLNEGGFIKKRAKEESVFKTNKNNYYLAIILTVATILLVVIALKGCC